MQRRAKFDGRRLRSERVRRNLSALALSRVVGCSDEAVLSWERGRSRPSPDTVRALAAFFGIGVRAFR